MKIKVVPEDFVVEELVEIPPGAGTVAVYRLRKSGATTLDALAAVARAFDLPRRCVRHLGLKDRHAVTTQHLWIEGGPERSLAEGPFRLDFLARASAPPIPRGNRFRIVLRDLDPAESPRLAEAVRAVAADGVPNYFDSQRFGSARHGEGFIGKKVLLRQWEEALRLFLAKPSRFDTEARRARMAAFKRHWGRWEACLARAATRSEAQIFGYLARRRGDFMGALKLIERPMLALFMHTYQSWLWNEAVGRYLKATLPSDLLFAARYLGGYLWFYRFIPADLAAKWRTMKVALLGYRSKHADRAVAEAYASVLRGERLEMKDLKPYGHNVPYMKAEDRPLLLLPAGLESTSPEADERHPGRKKAVVSFDLPRGGYATLVVKKLRLLISEGKEKGAEAEEEASSEEGDPTEGI